MQDAGERRLSGPERVVAAAQALGFDVEVRRMPASTRTAAEAAATCGCEVAQIVKSLVFQVESPADSQVEARDTLRLLLVAGDNRVDPDRIASETGERLGRADPKRVKAETGFAIGGVPPIGHAMPIAVWMDRSLLAHTTVWAAAGAPDAVFSTPPAALADVTGARIIDVT
ncbi:MAG: YbaK/EbsC family protein [Pseudomonadota bacterium]